MRGIRGDPWWLFLTVLGSFGNAFDKVVVEPAIPSVNNDVNVGPTLDCMDFQ